MADGAWARMSRRVGAFDALGVAGALFLICVLLAVLTDSFLSSGNLLQVARQASNYGILAVGMVFVLTMGDVDLSVGSVVTLVNIVTALALREGVPVPAAVALGLATGAACGAANGLLSVALRVPLIIVTLGTMSLYRGAAIVLSKSQPIGGFSKDHAFFSVGGESVLGVPVGVIVMVALAAVAHVLLEHTPFGWRVQAVGSNVQAARFSGIPVARYRVVVASLMGAVAGLGGVVALAFLRSGDLSTGFGYEIFVIAAAIIGGTSISGGSGSVAGAVLGALLIAVIRNGLIQLEVKAYWSTLVTGAVLLAAVAVGALIKRSGSDGRDRV
jgi:ribose transport system permease protein